MLGRSRSLASLLAPVVKVAADEDRPVSHLCADSREVQPGSLFVALAGKNHHGLAFIGDVLNRGATAVVAEPERVLDLAPHQELCGAAGVPLILVPDLAHKLSEIAGRFYGDPSQKIRVVGVTGTDGKTSTSQFIAQALSQEHMSCGVIGTLGYGLLEALVPASHTTPDAITVQRLLADMRELGARHAVMEVSSHALDQGRVAAVNFEVAVLTNLTRDHLDYHGSEEAYAAAKAKLFAMPGLKHAVLNRDDAFGRKLRAKLAEGVRLWDYSLNPRVDAAVVCQQLEFRPDGLDMAVQTPAGKASLSVPLLGRFNAANVLAALATLLALGTSLFDAISRLQRLHPVSGRMERFGGGELPTVIVDYAHTPGGLAAALDAVRAHTFGRVWLVFGCGGDRDRGKRPQMAQIADLKADEIVITDDNPRTEDPDRIVQDIIAGLVGHEPFIVRDRAEAISLAVTEASPGDAVLIAGKGHETYQIVGTRKQPFDDRQIVQRVLRERLQWSA